MAPPGFRSGPHGERSTAGLDWVEIMDVLSFATCLFAVSFGADRKTDRRYEERVYKNILYRLEVCGFPCIEKGNGTKIRVTFSLHSCYTFLGVNTKEEGTF